jgi:phosphate transport system permease protein
MATLPFGQPAAPAPALTRPAVSPPGTHPPGRAAAKRYVTKRTADDRVALLGSVAGSWGLVFVAYSRLLPFSGLAGFVLCWYVTFLVFYWLVSVVSQPTVVARDRLAGAVIWGGTLLVVLAVADTVVYTFIKGWAAAHYLNFFTKTMAGVAPDAPLNQGGILNAIVGTLIEVGIATLISLPLGVGTAVYMSEVGGKFASVVRTVVEAMTALPDILAGLFIYTTWIVALHNPKSGFAAALALSIMMLPIIARASEAVLRVVPGGLREASLALGASRWRTVRMVVLPTALPGLATALNLGIARAIGETAPVLITSGASSFMNVDPFHNPMNSMPLFAFVSWISGQRVYTARLWGDALVLLVLELLLFGSARLIAFVSSRPGRS